MTNPNHTPLLESSVCSGDETRAEEQPRLTPMFEQYLSIKKEYPNALLFYRMGDFYELFFKDAEIAAKELQLTLTSRNHNAEHPVAMCGVPWHAAQAYANQLVNKGYSVAVCDQTEDPRLAKGLVKRAVTHVLTAGTTLEDGSLESKGHSYLAAALWNAETDTGAVAWVDVSTGTWSGVQVKKTSDLWQWTLKMAPRELLLPEDTTLPPSLTREGDGGILLRRLPFKTHFDIKRAEQRILHAQGVQELGALGLSDTPELLRVCGALLAYLEQTQMKDPRHLEPFTPLNIGRHLIIDEITERNLELFRRLDGRKGIGTLRHVIDKTQTPMGGRLLEESLHNPWRDISVITAMQDAVEWMVHNEPVRTSLQEALHGVYDIERLSTRIALNRTSPQDLCSLRLSLAAFPKIHAALLADTKTDSAAAAPNSKKIPNAILNILKSWDDLSDISVLLDKALVDNPPAQVTEGGLFNPGYNAELDDILNLVEHGESLLEALLIKEQAALPKLKLGNNRVFGYYFELSKSASGAVPEHFIRRQTLATGERFTTPELTELEQRITSAVDKRKSLEYKLFQELRTVVSEVRPRLIFMAHIIARLDFWQSLAEAAVRNHWTRPTLDTSRELHIIAGRHPVIEDIIGESAFVPNDLHMDAQRRLILITGPNMAGKSTVLRQTALICLLAQMGSFVPAQEARIGICDRIFSRVGASDNLAQGQSTFMVEMMETARILRQSTKNSLVILDEIGRGTSTFDGLALAWAVAEDLAKRAGGEIRTLFATHYHEMTSLESRIPGVFTMNIAILERGSDIVFLRRLIPGPADRSYGVEVARLAGVPQPVVTRAREILTILEKNKSKLNPIPKTVPAFFDGLEPQATAPPPQPPDPEHPLVTILRDLNPEHITPIEALQKIVEWKNIWGTS